jgi:prepilin-type N-terminal cleavage/methylation domain-containing protein
MKLHRLQRIIFQQNQSGFTIIESLMALIVAGILLSAIAPVIILSTATRVQARRVELATQAARSFVDSLQSKTIPDPPIDSTRTLTASTAPNVRKVATSPNDYLLSSVVAPANRNGLYCYNKNGTITPPNPSSACNSDLFYIQAIRLAVSGTDPDQGQGYRLGVRVYRQDAFSGSAPLTRTADNQGKGKTQNSFTGGLGDSKAPLVEITTEITRGQSSYNSFCDRLGGCR